MNNTNTIIVFDLHGVLFTIDWSKVMRLLLHYPHKIRLFSCLLNVPFLWKGMKLATSGGTDEELSALIIKHCPSILPFIMEVMNTQKASPKMVKLVHALKKSGYPLHILSNIGPERFVVLKERFPEIIGLFDEVKTTNGDLKNILKKPDPQFYEEYKRMHNHDCKNIVFIDDNKKNIVAARKACFIGIRFKNPEQCTQEVADKIFCSPKGS